MKEERDTDHGKWGWWRIDPAVVQAYLACQPCRMMLHRRSETPHVSWFSSSSETCSLDTWAFLPHTIRGTKHKHPWSLPQNDHLSTLNSQLSPSTKFHSRERREIERENYSKPSRIQQKRMVKNPKKEKWKQLGRQVAA